MGLIGRHERLALEVAPARGDGRLIVEDVHLEVEACVLRCRRGIVQGAERGRHRTHSCKYLFQYGAAFRIHAGAWAVPRSS
jgi:hypothetical protein